MLVVLFSSNVFADEKMYLDEAKDNAEEVLVSKFYLSNGKYGYNLSIYSSTGGYGNGWFEGGIEAKASELCKEKGYVLIREETIQPNRRRQIIQCNE